MTAAPVAPVGAKLEDADESLDDKASDDAGEDELAESGTDSTPLTSSPDRPRKQKLLVPNRSMSPFDIRFSQMRARHEFRDKKLLEESAAQCKLVRCEEETEGGPTWRLEAPFPPIEVLQWRCKLRDESTGRPKLDPDTREVMWDTNDRWFTLDNRRLYCLQKAAVSVWPEKVIVAVVELKSALERIRELKKFRTLDTGRSIFIGGRREGETMDRWCWWEVAGLSEAPADEEKEEVKGEGEEPAANDSGAFNADRVQLRQKKKYTSGGRGADGRSGGRQASGNWGSRNGHERSKRGGWGRKDEAESETEGRFGQMSWGSLVVFLGIYVALRFVTKLTTTISNRRNAGSDATQAADATGSTPIVNAILTGGTAALLAAISVHLIRQKMH